MGYQSTKKGIPRLKWATGPECTGCPWRMKCFGFVPPDGAALILKNENIERWEYNLDHDIWLIGEAAGREEVVEGRPFRGAAGWNLDQVLEEAAIGIQKMDCYVTNVVKCRPVHLTSSGEPYISEYTGDHKNLTPPIEQQRECYRRYLRKELDNFKGKLIVTLGDIPLQVVTERKGIGSWRGTPLRSIPHGHLVFPTYHPMAFGYKPGLKVSTVRDLSRIPHVMTGKTEEQPAAQMILHGNVADLSRFTDCDMPTVDIETDGTLDPRAGNMTMIGISDDKEVGVCFPYNDTTREDLHQYIESRPALLGQNLYGFDAYWFIMKGMKIPDKIYDTMLMHHVANSEARHDLYSVQSEFAEYAEPNWKFKKNYRDNKALVNVKDVIQTRRAYWGLKKYLYYQGQWDLYDQLVMPLSWVCLQLRLRGTRVNKDLMYKYHIVMKRKIAKLEQMLRGAVGPFFNWKSPKQLAELLYDKLGLPEQRKEGKRTTERAALEKLEQAHPESKILKLIMSMRRLGKLNSTYFQMLLDDDDRVYPQLQPHGTATGRLSCKDPTIHNIPDGPARMIFIPDEGNVFIYFDYSQIEYMCWLWYGAEWQLLKKGFEGFDFHTMVAQIFFDLTYKEVTQERRHAAKFIDFGLIYGRGPHSIAKANGISVAQVERYISAWSEGIPGAWSIRDQWKRDVRSDGYLETVFHRRRFLHAKDVTKIYNAKPQGTAADITARALINVWSELQDPIRLTPLTVHDSLTVQCPPDHVRRALDQVTEIMMRPVPEMPARAAGFPDGTRFRVEAKVGNNWASYDEETNPQGLIPAAEWLEKYDK